MATNTLTLGTAQSVRIEQDEGYFSRLFPRIQKKKEYTSKDLAAGTMPGSEVVRMILEDPKKFASWSKEGFPKSKYTGILDQVLSRGNSAKDLGESLDSLKSVGISPSLKSLERFAQGLKTDNFMAVMKHIPSAQLHSDGGVNTISKILVENPHLRAPVLGSDLIKPRKEGIMQSFGELLQLNHFGGQRDHGVSLDRPLSTRSPELAL